MNVSNENDGIMYFAYRLQEATFHYTIDVYKSPIYNTNQLAREYVHVADLIENGELNKSYLEAIRDEFIDSIDHDVILKKYWGIDNINLIKQQIGTSNLFDIKKIMRYLSDIWDKAKYYNWCKKYIKEIVTQKNEKKKIEQAIRCFLPELYAYGYSNVYIYNAIKSTLLDKSKQNIDSFLNTFDCKIKEYDVYLAIDKDIYPFKDILVNHFEIEFEDDGCFNDLKKYDKSRYIVIKVKNVKAIDPNTAMINAKSIINIFTLFYIAVDNKNKFDIFRTAMIKWDEHKCYATDSDSGFSKIEKYTDLEAGNVAENTLKKLMDAFLYNKEALFSLMEILEKHNSAILDDNVDNSFLNLWSIFEMVTKNIDSGSKIERIRNIILMILTNNYFKRIINDLDKNLKNIIGEEKYREILSKVDTSNETDEYVLSCIVFLRENESLREEIYSLLKNNANIRSRISQLNDFSGNAKHLYGLIKKYENRVGWHITRMYRYRNCIVHSGTSEDNIEFICEHLHSYIDVVINDFIKHLTSEMNLNSIDDVIIYNKLYSKQLEKAINKDTPIDDETLRLLLQ